MSPAGPGGSGSDGMALTPVVKVEGTALTSEFANALSELRVRVAVRTIGRCTVRFDDHDHELVKTARFTMGATVQVLAKAVQDRSTQTPIFDGTVTSVSIEQRPGRTAELVVVAEDAAWGMSRGTKARTFLDSSYSDAVSAVLGDAGVSGTVTATSVKFPYLLQTDTDLAFIDELGRRCGYDWVVGPNKKFHFWPSWNSQGRTKSIGPAVRLEAGESLDEFSVKVSSDSPGKVTVRGWDRTDKKSVVGTVAAKVSLPSELMSVTGLKALQKGAVVDGRSGPESQADAETLATAAVRDGGVVTARGRTLCDPGLTPGGTVDLAGIGPASGTYFVHEVEHVYRHTGFTSSFVAGDRHVPTLADTAAGGPAVSSFLQLGLVPALVTNVNDTKHPGEAKVKFSVLGDSIESDWARVATIGGGAERGMSFIPEVNDEVLVGFEGGDVRHPVVLGGLFNGKDPALAGLVGSDGAVEKRRITSRLGHVVELGDGASPDKKHILLALGGGAKGSTPSHKLRLGQDKVDLAVPAGVPLTIAVGTSSITMDGNGGITIKGTTITLDAQQSVKIEGLDVTAKAKTKMAIEGGVAVQVKGEATASLEASGTTTVKGSMVMIN